MIRLLLLPVFLFLAACSQDFGWHQKLTMVIDTPDGPIVASAVQRMHVTYYPKWMRINGTSRLVELTGESPVADLGSGRIVLTILDTDFRMEKMFLDLGQRPEIFARIEDQVGQPPRTIRPKFYMPLPPFVSFTDISDPSTAFNFRSEDFPKVFGPGYALREMTLEITDEPVTIGTVERMLGLSFFQLHARLRKQWNTDVIAGTASPSYFESIGRSDFIRDFK